MAFHSYARHRGALLAGSMLVGWAVPAAAQQVNSVLSPPPVEAVAPAAAPADAGPIRSIVVTGNQRLESETVLSYIKLRIGEPYDRERLDAALRDLYGTDLFADVAIRDNQGNLTIEVRESPVVNRIVLEGNKRLKDDKIAPEIRLAPRQIFSRAKARADVARIIELYRRQGRFAATVEPKIVQLEQNRVDVVYEISEGPKSGIRQINILGNEKFGDGELRGEMVTKRTGLLSFLGSGDVYDPDRLAFDQQKLRMFYLTNGYADFRVVSAAAELTSDRRDFIITYVVEEGERYKFADVKVESAIRDFSGEGLTKLLPMKNGDWYNAKQVEDTVTSLNESAGLFGYAFADVQPNFRRDKDTKTMSVTFNVGETPRVYVERIDVSGNTITHDKVIRREFRVAEGDPFNSIRVRRSQERIRSLGFFDEGFEIEQQQGASSDRILLTAAVQEKATGQLQVSAGYSTQESFLVNLSITQPNFRGKGQEARASVNYSTYSKSAEIGFTEPYLFDRNIAVGGDIYRRDYNSYNYIGEERNTTYQQVTTGTQLRLGVPISEYTSLALRYSLSFDQVGLDRSSYYSDVDGDGVASCDPLLAGRYLCEAVGNRATSSIGYSLAYNAVNNGLRPTSGLRLTLNQDFAGLGGDVSYLRTRLTAAKFWPIGSTGLVLSTTFEGGYIHSLESGKDGAEPVRLTDRFFLGEPQIRGFDIRGIGPRVVRVPYTTDENGNAVLSTDKSGYTEDALGGRAYYMGRAEIEIPLSNRFRELGLRPSVYVDVGAVFGIRDPQTLDLPPGSAALVRNTLTDDGLRQCTDNSTGTVTTIDRGAAGCPSGTTIAATTISGFKEFYYGDSPKPRLSVGFGINWNSPFGPFRIDIAKALLKAEGDDTKLITFNIGTAF